jgi:hypothetical protein
VHPLITTMIATIRCWSAVMLLWQRYPWVLAEPEFWMLVAAGLMLLRIWVRPAVAA